MALSTESVRGYARSLGTKYETIASIWLFGSRANNRAHEQSDWDLMAFGPRELAGRSVGGVL
jgi:predicted nucleotidyltransferase